MLEDGLHNACIKTLTKSLITENIVTVTKLQLDRHASGGRDFRGRDQARFPDQGVDIVTQPAPSGGEEQQPSMGARRVLPLLDQARVGRERAGRAPVAAPAGVARGGGAAGAAGLG